MSSVLLAVAAIVQRKATSHSFYNRAVQVYIVSGFEERREFARIQARKLGGCCEAVMIEAPVGRAVLERRDCRWNASPRWREPASNESRGGGFMTWGEVACFAGHYSAWKRIARSGQPGIVMEDDARCLREFHRFPSAVGEAGFVYLGGLPLDPHDRAAIERGGDGWQRARDIYWALAYALTPLAAERLVEAAPVGNLIPLDEWLPYSYGATGRVGHGFYEPENIPDIEFWRPCRWHAEPAGIEAWKSGTEAGGAAFDLRVLVAASDPAKASRTLDAYGELGFHCEIACREGIHWPTNGRGGGFKLHGFREALSNHEGNRNWRDIALLSDGYDVLPLGTPQQVLHGFATGTASSRMHCPILFGGEEQCWPPSEPARFERLCALAGSEAVYPFLNSGLAIGWQRSIWNQLREPVALDCDDQEFWQDRMLAEPKLFAVDTEARVFANIHSSRSHYLLRNGYPRNLKTGYWPRILHANGPNKDLGFEQFAPEPPPAELAQDWLPPLAPDSGTLRLDRDICLVPVFEPAVAEHMAKVALSLDGWQPQREDPYPNPELRVSEADPDLLAHLQKAVLPRIAAAYKECWQVGSCGRIADAFFSKSEAGKPTLQTHNDSSRVSVSIVLQRAERGGHLHWPRQGLRDTEVRPGTAIVWPGQVSHPHGILPVEAGTRVSLVLWLRD